MTLIDYIRVLGGLFLFQVPVLAVASGGLWVALSRRRQLSRVAKWAAWGFGMLIAYSLASAFLSFAVAVVRTSQLRQAADLATALTTLNLWGLAAYPLFVVGLAVLARAVFLDRSQEMGNARQADPRAAGFQA